VNILKVRTFIPQQEMRKYTFGRDYLKKTFSSSSNGLPFEGI
jgi:hypothetical protein